MRGPITSLDYLHLLESASVEAHSRGDHRIGTGHLLLVMLRDTPALRELGLSVEAVTSQLARAPSSEPPCDPATVARSEWKLPVSFTANAWAALIHSHAIERELRRQSGNDDHYQQLDELYALLGAATMREDYELAASLRDRIAEAKKRMPRLQAQHLALALLDDLGCDAAQIVERFGLHVEQVRTLVRRQLNSCTAS